MYTYRFETRQEATKELEHWTNPINSKYVEACLLVEKVDTKTYYTVLVDKR